MKRSHVLALVAAGLFLTCAGLLFPAIVRVRQAAARMHCTSNLKQWALALHTYASASAPRIRDGKSACNALPAGTVPNADLSPEQRLSWYVSVLPYVEQDNVFKQFDLARGTGDPANEKATGNRIQQFVCPASGEYDRDTRQWKSPTPLTHYVGVAGVGADAAVLPLGHPKTGVFGYNRRTAIPDDFLDGTSNTLVIIETANNPGHWAHGGLATVRTFEPGTSPYLGEGRAFGGFHSTDAFQFRKRSVLCVAALADGSVLSFSNTTDPTVLEAFATVAGREVIPANW